MGLKALAGSVAAITGTQSTGIPVLLAMSYVAVSGAADTNNNTLATIALPAGTMASNGALRITTHWSWTNSANIKTPSIVLGSTAIWAPAGFASTASLTQMTFVANRNSASSQFITNTAYVGGFGSSTLATPAAATENTANALNLLIKGQKALGSETMTLEGYIVEYIKASNS